jgi:hypothetical protein
MVTVAVELQGRELLTYHVLIFSIIMDFVYSALGQAKNTAAVISVFTFYKPICYVSFPFSIRGRLSYAVFFEWEMVALWGLDLHSSVI